ncbi:MAG TPA: NAD(P)/FAD-dependent oxidoreductase [Marmoricola sp.]|nr:NAD(P)/FAD-dependent oxidoreductase [Marmoricola sp.]
MSKIIVIGSGFGGLASALRLAKLGHDVTIVEASSDLGGVLTPLTEGDFTWNTVYSTALPAVTRDLFRKSGRPLESELELEQLPLARQHRFEDGVVLDLTSGSRGDQQATIESAMGAKAAGQWTAYVDRFVPVWEAMRQDIYERPWSPELASKDTLDLLKSRLTMYRMARRDLHDKRLQAMAMHAAILDGHNPRDVPAWMGLWTYVEENFGTWRPVGGMAALREALITRLETRKVTTMTNASAEDLVIESGRVVGVKTSSGDLDADIVVITGDPRRLPSLAEYVIKTTPAIPPVVAHLGLVGDVPDLPGEVVFHGDPTVVVRPEPDAKPGTAAWTVLARGRVAEDLVNMLHRNGLKVRKNIEVRVDRSPRALVEHWNGSPLGTAWQGRATFAQRLGPTTPIQGVYVAGAHSRTGAGLPAVGLSAASLATLIGN